MKIKEDIEALLSSLEKENIFGVTELFYNKIFLNENEKIIFVDWYLRVQERIDILTEMLKIIVESDIYSISLPEKIIVEYLKAKRALEKIRLRKDLMWLVFGSDDNYSSFVYN